MSGRYERNQRKGQRGEARFEQWWLSRGPRYRIQERQPPGCDFLVRNPWSPPFLRVEVKLRESLTWSGGGVCAGPGYYSINRFDKALFDFLYAITPDGAFFIPVSAITARAHVMLPAGRPTAGKYGCFWVDPAPALVPA